VNLELEGETSEPLVWDADAPVSSAFEIGSSPLRHQIEEDDALGLSRRADASLFSLERTVSFLSASVKQAMEVSRRVPEEVERLYQQLAEERARFERARKRIEALERQLEDQRRAAAEFKKALMAEQDAFLKAILDEHERELDALRAELAARDGAAG